MFNILKNMPPAVYISFISVAIILILVVLVINHKSYPKSYIIAFCLMIMSGITLIILKLEWLSNFKQALVLLVFVLLILGLSVLFISGFIHNKRNGIKINKTFKKIIIASLIVAFIGICFVAFCLYMKNR